MRRKIRNIKLPSSIFLLCKSGAYLTGSFVKYVIGEKKSFVDYDLIVPPEKWHVVCLLIPKDAKVNTHGGLKFVDKHNNEIDIWPCSIGQHLSQCKGMTCGQDYVYDYINNKIFTSFSIGTQNGHNRYIK